ncbi:MAG: hypothetical protein FGF52_03405 [Candidatus Brockarchaeota archaeon]|nr:hypothetical protein [Candidatus Brockarchaeota archaeon]
MAHLLHEIIEATSSGKLGKMSEAIGEIGERVVILGEIKEINYKGDILAALSQKIGIQLKESDVELKYGKELEGASKPDGVIKAKEDIKMESGI